MTIKTIRTPSAVPISVTQNGDVFVWKDDTFTGDPELVGDICVGTVSGRFGYRTAADIPPEVLTEAWWSEIDSAAGPDGLAFVQEVIQFQQRIAKSPLNRMWRIHAFRTSDRLQTIRVGFQVRAYDKDNDAWRTIGELANLHGAAIEIVDQFFHPQGADPAFPMTVVKVWWERSRVPQLDTPPLVLLWEEFGPHKYAV